MDSTYLPTFETGKKILEEIRSKVPTKPLQTEEEFQALGAAMIKATEFYNWWTSFMKPLVKKAHEHHKETKAKMDELAEPAMESINLMKPYHMEFKNREAMLRAAEEARRTAELAAMTPAGQNILPIAVTLPKLNVQDGISERATWRAEITDMMKLVKAVASGKLPMTYLLPNMVALNEQARSLKSEMNVPKERIPGVVAVEKVTAVISVQ